MQDGCSTRIVPRLGAPASAIARAIARTDFVRRSAFSIGGRGYHKEWQHFVVLARDLALLVNFSLSDDMRPTASRGAEIARITTLVHEPGSGGAWDGDVETYRAEDVHVAGGRIDLAFRGNRLRFHDGAFTITAALADRPIALELRLTPETMPAFVPNIPMLDGPPLHWVVVPRLRVEGHATIAGRDYRLDGAPAYHDHNWGYFRWGHDVSWEWGFVLPRDAAVPWGLTFVRLTNRARTMALAQGAFVWRRSEQVRVFREDDVEFETAAGYLRPARVFKVPRVLALLVPGTATDVPAWFDVRAAAGGDRLHCRCDGQDIAQVLIPSETRLGVTIFNEVAARARVEGRIGRERLAYDGTAVLEFIRHA
jgi:hypothetical protein